MLANRLRMATDSGPLVASAQTANTVAGATLAISKPPGTVDGDIMVAVMAAGTGGTTWTGDTGWTEVFDIGVSPRLRIAYKVAASEGSSYTFTQAEPTAVCTGAIMTFRGVAYDVIGSDFVSSGTSPIVAPGITAVGGLLLACYAKNTVSTTFTTPSGMTSVVTDSSRYHVFSETIASGDTGSRTSTPSTASGATVGVLLALKPA